MTELEKAFAGEQFNRRDGEVARHMAKVKDLCFEFNSIKPSDPKRNKIVEELVTGYVVSFFGLISALYTIQMMEFQLIMFATNGTVDTSMYYMQLFTQGAIFVVAIAIAYLFSKKFCKQG